MYMLRFCFCFCFWRGQLAILHNLNAVSITTIWVGLGNKLEREVVMSLFKSVRKTKFRRPTLSPLLGLICLQVAAGPHLPSWEEGNV